MPELDYREMYPRLMAEVIFKKKFPDHNIDLAKYPPFILRDKALNVSKGEHTIEKSEGVKIYE